MRAMVKIAPSQIGNRVSLLPGDDVIETVNYF